MKNCTFLVSDQIDTKIKAIELEKGEFGGDVDDNESLICFIPRPKQY